MRIEGKVKNTQRYVGSIDENHLADQDYSFLDNKLSNFTEKEMEIGMGAFEVWPVEVVHLANHSVAL